MGNKETEKIPEESAKHAEKIRSEKFASEAKEIQKFFGEKDAIQQDFTKQLYQSMKDAGIDLDPLLSNMKDSLKKHRDEIMKRKFEGSLF
jgi:hypothetical protein